MFNRYKLNFVFICVVLCGLVDLGRIVQRSVSAHGEEGSNFFFISVYFLLFKSFSRIYFFLPAVAVKWATLRLGSPIPKTLMIWASPSHITSAIWVRIKVRVTGDTHITRSELGIGMHKTWGCP